MSKNQIDIKHIQDCLTNIGYQISELTESKNNGSLWIFKFYNSQAIVTVYDTVNNENSLVQGKIGKDEQSQLKQLVDGFRCHTLDIHPLNNEIVQIINSGKEDYYYDFKREWHNNTVNLIHDIICLSNNTENKDSYLIIGVTDPKDNEINTANKIVEFEQKYNTAKISNLLESVKWGSNHPEVEVVDLYYMYKKISVLICKKSKYIPFYLTERFSKDKKEIRPYHIYTRTNDTNTSIDRSATFTELEKLWQLHFDRK